MLDFSKNYFALFSIPVGFHVNLEQLAARYYSLQSVLHPDRFTQSSDRERRLSVQGASWVNEAYATLTDPGLRARYLLQLQGIRFDDERDTASDSAFLMQHMEWREAVTDAADTAAPLSALDDVAEGVLAEEKKLYREFESHYLATKYDVARECVLKMNFYHRLLEEIKQQQACIEDRLL